MAGMPPPPAPPAPVPNPPQWMSQAPTTPMHAMRTLMPPMSFLFRVLGFTLLFVAALVVVAFAYPGGGCFSATASSCGAGSSYQTGAANAVLAGNILFTIGLFLLGLGAGMKLHYGLQSSPTGNAEDNAFIIADRRLNGLIFTVSVALLLALMVIATFHGPL